MPCHAISRLLIQTSFSVSNRSSLVPLSKTMHITKLILGALCVAAPALAHMEMIKPYALRSQYDPANDWSNIDYDNTSPLSSSGMSLPSLLSISNHLAVQC